MATEGENATGKLGILQMEGKMREQIRELQERRASVMMTEISDLHKERDLAVNRVKQLEKTVAELQSECAAVKTKLLDENELNFKIKSLERTLLEERLVNNDLKSKLEDAEKKANELTTKLRRKSVDHRSPMVQKRLDQLTKSSSQSLGDLTIAQGVQRLEDASTMSGSMPDIHPDLTNGHKGIIPSSKLNQRIFHAPLGQSPLVSPSSSPSGSPTITHRRYKLAVNTGSDAQTQTDDLLLCQSGSQDTGNSHVAEVQRLQQENEQLRLKLHQKCEESSRRKEERKKILAQIQELDGEKASLKESLSHFTHWVYDKLSSVEEEMDICKVVYAFHSSPTQEARLIEELRKKVTNREVSIRKLKMKNKYLKIALREHEGNLVKSREEASNLQEQMERATSVLGSPLSTLADLNKHLSSVQLHQRKLPSPLTKKRQLEQEAGMQQYSKKPNNY